MIEGLRLSSSLHQILLNDLGDLTRTYGAAALTDGETQTLVASYGSEQLNLDLNVVAGHYHLYALGESDLTGNIECADVELGTVVVVEGGVTAAFFFLQDIN